MLSLQGSIRTCKVDTGWSARMQSDRFLNPGNMMCPTWSGMDSTGRTVCDYSFYTKSAGCNSASDRVDVENDQRPKYVEYIALNAAGIDGSMYGDSYGGNNMFYNDTVKGNKSADAANNLTGNFGLDFRAQTAPNCSITPYKDAMAQNADVRRNEQRAELGYNTQQFRNRSNNH